MELYDHAANNTADKMEFHYQNRNKFYLSKMKFHYGKIFFEKKYALSWGNMKAKK